MLITILSISNIIDSESLVDIEWYDSLLFLLDVGMGLVIIAFSIVICDRYPEAKEEQNV